MISVCIATFNGEKYIKQQLDSILLQLGADDEVIISDDDSKDNTRLIIAEFVDSRIKVIRNPFRGVVSNFENAIKHATGDYIFLADQDDVWVDNKVESVLKDFSQGYDLILSDCTMFDSATGKILHESFFTFNKSKRGVLKNILRNSYIGCCMAFNREVRQKILPFPKNIPMHDSWIGIMSELYFNVYFDPRKLIKYRSHSENASFTSSGKSEYKLIKKLSFRWSLIYSIVINYFKS